MTKKMISLFPIAIALVLTPNAMPQNPHHPSRQTVVSADGISAEDIENYVLTAPSAKDGQQELMTLTCVKKPCYVFKKGDTVTIIDDGLKKVGSRFHNKQEIVMKICGAPTGCFEVALLTEKNPWLTKNN